MTVACIGALSCSSAAANRLLTGGYSSQGGVSSAEDFCNSSGLACRTDEYGGCWLQCYGHRRRRHKERGRKASLFFDLGYFKSGNLACLNTCSLTDVYN